MRKLKPWQYEVAGAFYSFAAMRVFSFSTVALNQKPEPEARNWLTVLTLL
jgi:hypothetical protein